MVRTVVAAPPIPQLPMVDSHPWLPPAPGVAAGPCRRCSAGPLAEAHVSANPARSAAIALERHHRARDVLRTCEDRLDDLLRAPSAGRTFADGVRVGQLALELVEGALAGSSGTPA